MEPMEVENSIKALTGGCSCGRNRYAVSIPTNSSEKAQIYFDSGRSQHRYHASPLSAWLRIPLIWYSSTTIPVLADETHASIKRVYSPPNEKSQRHFCGFCGTPLSYWSEQPPSEADYISLTLGSLSGTDLGNLEDMGAFPKEAVEEAESDRRLINSGVTATDTLPWFEKMVEGSTLGKIRRTGLRREDGVRVVEWEIVEWTEAEGDASPGKRKIGELEADDGSTKIGE